MPTQLERSSRASLLSAEVLDRSRVLDTLVNNLDGMAYRCLNDIYWKMIFVSQGCTALTGYAPAEIVEDTRISWWEITHPHDRSRVRECIDTAVQSGQRFAIQYRITTLSGHIKWVVERGVAVPDEHGEIVIEGFIEDISEHRGMLEALEQAELRYRNIFEHASEGIFQTTGDGHYLAANPALARIYGYATPQELIADLSDIGQRLYAHSGRREAFQRLMETQGEVLNFESEVYRHDGSRIWISENAHVVRGPQGEFIWTSLNENTTRNSWNARPITIC
jgi:PAS domain S-box-containing protein